MFSNFFTAIRVAYLASQITVRYTQQKGPTLAYHHPLEQTLFDALNGSSSGGYVHWGVYESGKSTALREVAWRLQEETGRQVIYIHGYDFSHLVPMSARMRQAIGVPVDMSHEPISKFFTHSAVTIVIDHADTLMRDKDKSCDDTLELVRELIKQSEKTHKFNFLLVVNSWERAKELVDVGCKLLPGNFPGRWTREQLENLFSTFPEHVKSKIGNSKEELLHLATISGTPGYLNFEAHCDRLNFNPRYAAMHNLEWHKGIKSLYNTRLELPDWSPEVTTEGRFPDKNGIYHHEDLASLRVGM
jgi:hypothetical protein